MQPLVVTLTLNPALDLTTSVDCIVPFQKLRCGPMRRDAGGGGINVARVLQRWGGSVLAIHTAGGATGEKLKRLIAQEGLRCEVLPLVADTREDFTVYETQTGRQFRFIEPGAALLAEDVDRCEAALAAIRPAPAYVVASGSLPPGSPTDAYARCVASARAVGARAVLDASGPALARALEQGVFLVKPNQRELTELFDRKLETRTEQVAACRDLVRSGRAEIVALTLAEQGALAVTRTGSWYAAAPAVRAVSTVGAGDSFLGTMLWRLLCGDEVQQALRYGVAAGSASLLAPGTALCRVTDVEALVPHIASELIGPGA